MKILSCTILNLVIGKYALQIMNEPLKEIIHIIGIGGIGMSAIAEVLKRNNYKVQGSDTQSNDNVARLKNLCIEVYIGHRANNIENAQTVVYSSAIKPDNVELIAAKESNKVILHRSEILAEILKGKYVIAVSGSSGKTTTTAMISSIFDYSDTNATVIVGGILNSQQSNTKLGKSNVFLIEADESDGTMLKIPVNVAVITSVNDDHIDCYGTFGDIKSSFSQFVNKADFAILPDSADVNCSTKNVKFGFEDSDVRAINVEQYYNSMKFDVLINCCNKKYSLENIVLSNAVGLHKVSNALAAISVAVKLGISEESIRKGLLEFKGVARRFSLVAEVNGVKLIEDYAHHPTEIQATLTAARSISDGKIIGIIEPLRFARVRNFFDEFIKIFMKFDYVILTPVHPPEDKPIPGYDIVDIEKALISSGFNNVKIMNDSALISHFISSVTSSGDIVLFIGAGGNIAKLTRETAQILT